MKELRKETRLLMVRLSDDEQRIRGIELAKAHMEMDALTEKKREVADDIKSLQARIDALAVVVQNCQEERPVTVNVIPNYGDGTLRVVRIDTGDTVESRNLTAGENQPDLI